MRFSPGSLGETLMGMRGVWHDSIQLYQLNGDALHEDTWSGTPGLAPYENLVYIEFDGEQYRQTNVCFRGRPLHVRSFQGVVQDGILRFAALGPQDPSHIGVAAGPGRIIFSPATVTAAWEKYVEPDFIELLGPGQRLRTTLLYRHGAAARTLHARGSLLSPDGSRRLPYDPRGADGPVHEALRDTRVFHE